MESRRRSLVKSASWVAIGMSIVTGVVYLMTGELYLSLEIGAVVTALKVVGCYLHERLWSRVRWGLAEGAEVARAAAADVEEAIE